MAISLDATVGGANANTYITLDDANSFIEGLVLSDDAAEVSFTVTNSKVAATDVVVACHGSAGTAGAYIVSANSIAAGSFKITVSNVSGGSLSEAIVINFVALKGASS